MIDCLCLGSFNSDLIHFRKMFYLFVLGFFFFLTDFEGEKTTFLSISEVRINGQRSSPSVLRGWEPRVHARSFRFIFRSHLRIVTMDIVRNQYSTVHTAKQ